MEEKARNILKSLGVVPSQQEVLTLENEIKRLVFAAVTRERQRCYQVALRFRDEFEKYPALPQNIAVASETIADTILSGQYNNSVEKFTKAV